MSNAGAARAHEAVSVAIKSGALAPITASTRCVDCGAPAAHYDHRDYSKPLDVEPVCALCNRRRGPALPDAASETMERLNFYVPEPCFSALRSISRATRTSVSKLIRQAITEYLRKEQK